MNRKPVLIFLILALIIPGLSYSKKKEIRPAPVVQIKFQSAIPGKSYKPEFDARDFTVKAFSKDYKISYNGKMVLNKYTTKLFTNQFYIEDIQFAVYSNDLLIIYRFNDVISSGSRIAKFNKDTLEKQWDIPVSGFNIEKSIIEANYAYLVTADMLCKIDLVKGIFAWKKDNLSKKYKISNVAGISLKKDSVEFPVKTQDKTLKTSAIVLKLNKSSGKLL